MDKRRQELEELQEDIHLALLMDEYADSMGTEVRAEAEKAFETGEITIPREADDACLSIISQTTKVEHQKKSTKTVARYLLVAAATVIALFGTLMVVQASGINVFGKLASWTDSVFHFDSGAKAIQAEEKGHTPEVKAALEELGLPIALAPVRLPEGYTVIDVQGTNLDLIKAVAIAAERNNYMIQIVIGEYTDETMINKALWEKNEQSAQIFTTNGRAFYLFENESGWSGVWSDGCYVVSLLGFESLNDLKTVVASIGVR